MFTTGAVLSTSMPIFFAAVLAALSFATMTKLWLPSTGGVVFKAISISKVLLFPVEMPEPVVVLYTTFAMPALVVFETFQPAVVVVFTRLKPKGSVMLIAVILSVPVL